MCPLTLENPKRETEVVHPPPRSATTFLINMVSELLMAEMVGLPRMKME
jgi:hypothetical protein